MTKQEAFETIVEAAEQYVFDLENSGRWAEAIKIETSIGICQAYLTTELQKAKAAL